MVRRETERILVAHLRGQRCRVTRTDAEIWRIDASVRAGERPPGFQENDTVHAGELCGDAARSGERFESERAGCVQLRFGSWPQQYGASGGGAGNDRGR